MKAMIDLAPYQIPPVEFISAYWARRSGKQIMPPPPLHAPIHHTSNPPHVDLLDHARPRLDARQKQNRLLNLRGQVGQPHDLRHAGTGHFGIVGQI